MYLCASVYICLGVTCWVKGWLLGSRLWCLILSLSLSLWYPGSGMVLDCINSWSLHSYLLLSHGFELWYWHWFCAAESRFLHTISLRRTFECSLMNILQQVEEIWSRNEIQGYIRWSWNVTLTLGLCTLFNWEEYLVKFIENRLKGLGDMKQTRVEGEITLPWSMI